MNHSLRYFAPGLLLLLNPLFAIGGLTGPGIKIPSARPLDASRVEVNLEYSLYHAHYRFLDDGNKNRIPATESSTYPGEVYSTISENGLGMSLTTGLGSGWEAGFAYGHTTSETGDGGLAVTKFNELQLGAKYAILQPEKHAFALQTGINLEPVRWTLSTEAGFLYSFFPSDSAHIDIDLRYYGSQNRQQEDQRAIERGSIAQIGCGLQLGRFSPTLEFSYHEIRTMRWRRYRVQNDLLPFVKAGLMDEEPDLYDALQIRNSVAIQLPSTAGMTVPLDHPREKVAHIRRILQLTAGTTVELNQSVSLAMAVTQDMSGSNTLAGQTVASTITMLF